MQQLTITISGMTCEHCTQSVQNALNRLEGVKASVCLDNELAMVDTEGRVANMRLLKEIEALGYRASLQTINTKTTSNESGLHLAIVGTGSAAFAAAIKAVEQGATVTIIEAADNIGGTCVNIGCVPSKIFIRAAHIAHIQGHHSFNGLALNTAKIDRKAMLMQQQEQVEKLRYAKYESIIENNPGINLLQGMARFKDGSTLIVTTKHGDETEIKADRILLAVGASPSIPAINGLKETPYWTSTEALVAKAVPEHLIVLGASVVALELAQAFRRIGADVTILARSSLLSREDPDIGKGLLQIFEDEGIKVILNTSVEKVKYMDKKFILQTSTGEVKGEKLLLATGRVADTTALDLAKVGIKTDKHGDIIIDKYMHTNIKNIYAAGDCTNQPQFVYVAAAAGTRAARNMTGDNVSIDLSVMPAVVFTEPQVASVGLTEQQAKKQRLEVDSRTLSLENVPRALVNFDTRGFIKLVAEKNTGRIVGCQLLADQGGEIIQTAALAIRNRMTVTDLAEQLFPYLTMVEGLKLTAQTFNKDVKQLSCCAG